MTFTTLIALNAILDLAVVLALASLVYLAHRRLDATSSGALLTQLRPEADAVETLSEAA